VPDHDDYDLGQGAGFYINATQEPWTQHFKMWDYVAKELPDLVAEHFAIDPIRQSITGHSMGGHGALTMALALPGRFRAVSSFAPILNPTNSDWGRKQFAAYWGDEANWGPHDATMLIKGTAFDGPMLIDTGADDQFFDLLGTSAFAAAFADKRQQGAIRLQPGYDHSYFFVSSFIEEHITFHAAELWA
jgi:S-formylglutathione hydrolase